MTKMTSPEKTLNSTHIRALLQRLGWTVPLAVLLFFALVLVMFYFFRAMPMALERAESFQRDATTPVVSRIEGLSSQVERILLTTKDWVRDGTISIDDHVTLNRMLIPVIAQRSIVSSIHIAKDDGREVLLLKSPEGWKNRITDIPRKATQQHWLVWKDARSLLTDEWKEQDYDPRKRPWFAGAMASPENQVHWTAPYIFQSTQEPGITASVRWKDAASGGQFVVAFDVLLIDLSKMTRELAYGQQGKVALITADGKVLGLPRLSGFDTDDAAKKALLQEPDKIGLPLLAVTLREAGESQNLRIKPGESGTSEEWLVSLKPVKFRNQEFRLALMVPAREFDVWSTQLIGLLFGTFGFLSLIGYYFARRLQSQVTVPVSGLFEQIEDSNRKLGAGQARNAAIADLAPRLQDAQSFDSLSSTLLSGFEKYLGIGQGSVYRVDINKEKLHLCSGYARQEGLSAAATIAFGEGRRVRAAGKALHLRALLRAHGKVDERQVAAQRPNQSGRSNGRHWRDCQCAQCTADTDSRHRTQCRAASADFYGIGRYGGTGAEKEGRAPNHSGR
jgi:hypothetical protein